MGGDRGPDEVVRGALEAARDGISPVVYGPASLDTRGLEHVTAEQVVAMDEKAAEAVRSKPDSSLVASRFGPTDPDAQPELCNGALSVGPAAELTMHLSGDVDLRPLGSVEVAG